VVVVCGVSNLARCFDDIAVILFLVWVGSSSGSRGFFGSKVKWSREGERGGSV